MSDLRFTSFYSLYGARLDIDALLSRTRPKRRAELWHRGEANAIGKKHVTSGIQIDLHRGSSTPSLHRAIRAFLEDEHRFLRAASALTGPKVWSLIRTGLFVHAAGPVTLYLPSDLMALAARRGVGWSITGYPCSD